MRGEGDDCGRTIDPAEPGPVRLDLSLARVFVVSGRHAAPACNALAVPRADRTLRKQRAELILTPCVDLTEVLSKPCWFGRRGGDGLAAGLDGLRGLCQRFYEQGPQRQRGAGVSQRLGGCWGEPDVDEVGRWRPQHPQGLLRRQRRCGSGFAASSGTLSCCRAGGAVDRSLLASSLGRCVEVRWF